MDAVFTALGDAMVATSEAQAESAKAWSDGAIELCGALWAFATGEGATLAVGTALAVFVFVATATGGPLAAGLCVCAAVAVGTGGAAVVTVDAFTLAVEAIFSSVIVPLLLIPMVLLTSLDDAVIGLGNWIFLPAALSVAALLTLEAREPLRHLAAAVRAAARATREYVVKKQAANRAYWAAVRARHLRRRKVAMASAVSAPGRDGRPALAGSAHARARLRIAEMMR